MESKTWCRKYTIKFIASFFDLVDAPGICQIVLSGNINMRTHLVSDDDKWPRAMLECRFHLLTVSMQRMNVKSHQNSVSSGYNTISPHYTKQLLQIR